jgi:hypothetical protein
VRILSSIFAPKLSFSIMPEGGGAAGRTEDRFERSPIRSQFKASMAAGKFDQSRTINEAYQSLTSLRETLKKLPRGSVVLDLGAGSGITVASASRGHSVVSRARMMANSVVSPEQLAELEGLHFIGVTATPEEQLEVPAVDPAGHYEVLAGRLFEEVDVPALKAKLAEKKVVAFSLLGVFPYTPTPDLALETLHELLPVGAELHISSGIDHGFQLPDGQLIRFSAYIERTEGFAAVPGKPGVFERTSRPFKRVPLTLVDSAGGKPPCRYFRIDDAGLSDEERSKLELIFLRDAWASQAGSKVASSAIKWVGSVDRQRGRGVPANYFEPAFGPYQDATVDRMCPGLRAAVFSNLILNGKRAQAVRYFDAHRSAFEQYPELSPIYRGFRDIVAGETNSESARTLASIFENPARSELGNTTRALLRVLADRGTELSKLDDFKVSADALRWADDFLAGRCAELGFDQPYTTQLSLRMSLERSLDFLIAAWKTSPEVRRWMR